MHTKKQCLLIVAVITVFAMTGLSMAALIGTPLSYPMVAFGSGTTSYNATSHLLSITATPAAFRTSSTATPRSIVTPAGGTRTLSINIMVDNAGALVGGAGGTDLVITGAVDLNGDGVIDYTGTLLTGQIAQFGFNDSGSNTDYYDFRFVVTGGAFTQGSSPVYPLNSAVGITVTSESSNFTGSFATNITGGAKGNVGTVCIGAIGDQVWLDSNRNGIQETGEPGISGVTVQLLDTFSNVLASTTTDASGFYKFTGLCGTQYRVQVDETTLPAGTGYLPTLSNEGSDSTLDSNGSPADVTLVGGNADMTIDFGYKAPCTGTIGDFVWHDSNRDGIQGSGEPGIGGVTLSLLDASGNVMSSTTSSSDGSYKFTGLCAGSYQVRVDTVPSSDYSLTTANVGGSDLDSNPNPSSVTLSGDTSSDVTVDFGFVTPCTGSIGDLVWHDVNHNGIQDAGDSAVPNVTVVLGGPGGSRSTTTNANGIYQFTGLCAGQYTVTVDASTLPSTDYSPVVSPSGTDAAIDSNQSPATVTLAADDSSDTTIDFGYETPCTGVVGDFVWKDLDGDGIQDTGEPGIGGVTVRLVGGGRTPSTVTDANGYYQFGGLCAGDCTVSVDLTSLSADLAATQSNIGDFSTDSNGSPATVALSSDDVSDLSIDFGYVCTGVIGNFVWQDQNHNGIQDAGESGISNVRLVLWDSLGNAVAETWSDGNGHYEFDRVCGGSYTVQVDESTVPNWFTATTKNAAGSTIENDSNGNNAAVKLSASNNFQDLTIDFGYMCAGVIGDFVWYDKDHDGVQDDGEPGLAGVWVDLLDASGTTTIATQVTDANGHYQFIGLCGGNYSVKVSSGVPDGYTPTKTLAGTDLTKDSNGSPASAVLPTSSGQWTDYSIDFGYQGPCSGTIGDFVWNDRNRNGIQDGTEPGINGITVYLLDGNGQQIAQTETATSQGRDGHYQFTGLCAGTYTVQVNESDLPPDFIATTPNVGDDRSSDSSDSPATVILATDTSSDVTVDFGYEHPCTGSIGNFVWHDLNGNGIQNDGEPGIDGVKVKLTDSAGNVRTTTTVLGPDGHGYYQFEGLCDGTYKVEVDASTLPLGYNPTTASASGSTISNDSNGSPATVVLPTSGGQWADNSVDFGYISQCWGKIGDFVWRDLDHDGIQDTGEPGINGVTVKLTDTSGHVLRSTSTSNNPDTGLAGYYQFAGLCAGTYKVKVCPPCGYEWTTTGAGADSTKDSNGKDAVVTLLSDDSQNPASSDQTIDFGFVTPCNGKIGNFTWFDKDLNGLQSPCEQGIDGVILRLKDASGTVITTTTSGAASCGWHGYYKFAGLCAGTYTVEAVTPDGYKPTTSNVGSNSSIDSNSVPATVVLRTDNDVNETIDFGYIRKPQAGCGTPGYWKNHPEAWPVDKITIGGKTYTKTQAIALMKTCNSRDVTYTMFESLVAAKLNVLIGNNSTCIDNTIDSADDWMATYGPVGRGVSAGGCYSPWRTGDSLHQKLDDFNNGLLCAPSRESCGR